MRIAIYIRRNTPAAWKVAAGALEYADTDEEVGIVLPYSKEASVTDQDCSQWDGAIVLRRVADLPVPQVCVSSLTPPEDLSVTVDERMIGELVVNQFTSIGLQHFAFAGYAGSLGYEITKLRWAHFSTVLRERGLVPTLFHVDRHPMETLAKVPKPCGVMAVNDRFGLDFMARCAEAGLRIPGEVSVIGVDNTPEGQQASPAMSSVVNPFSLIGFHAARVCAQLIRGEPVESLTVEPSGIILRGSVTEPGSEMNTAAAVAHFMRMNMDQAIEMEDLLRQSNLSRRWLEQLFRSAYGSSPMAYLKGLRLERAKHLLQTSSLSLKEIVKATGHRDANHLCRIFRQRLKSTPLRYREAGGKES